MTGAALSEVSAMSFAWRGCQHLNQWRCSQLLSPTPCWWRDAHFSQLQNVSKRKNMQTAKTSRKAEVRWVGGPPLLSLVSLAVKYISVFFDFPMNWTKNLPGSCYCPRHIKVLILAVNFTKLFKLGHDLSPLLFERQIKLRGEKQAALYLASPSQKYLKCCLRQKTPEG